MTNYEKNMNAVSKALPGLHHWLQEQKEMHWVEEVIGMDGKINCLTKDGGRVEAFADLKYPRREAEKIAKMYKYNKEDITIILGIGNGVMLDCVQQQIKQHHHIVVVEPIGQLIKVAFKNYDFSELILTNRLFVVAPGKDEVREVFAYLESAVVIEQWHYITHPYTRARAKEYHELTLYTSELMNQFASNAGTIAAAGEKIAQNDIETLPYVINHRGVIELADKFKGLPAILVSTGPSLEKNIHMLKDIQGKAVIICVGQAIRPLLAYGVTPDFACSVDYGEVNMSHYKGIMDCNIPLVVLNRSYAPLIKEYAGPKFIVVSANPFVEETVVGVLQNKGSVDQGGSVAHLCFSFAKSLGCDPIILLGQDLSLSSTSHMKQTDTGGNVVVNDQGFIDWEVTDESSHLHGGSHSMGPAVHVPGYYGSAVVTNTGLAAFITAFEGMIATYAGTTYNCTQGGAFIKGALHRHLDWVIDKELQNEIDKSCIAPLLTPAEDGAELVAKAIPILKKEIKLLKKVVDHCTKALDTCEDLRTICAQKRRTSGALETALAENEKHSTLARDASAELPLVSLAIYGAKRAIQSKAMNGEENKTAKYLKKKKHQSILVKRIDRNEFILKAAKESTERFIEWYTQTLKLLESDMKLIPEPEPLPDLTDVESYFAVGNFSHPLSSSKRLLQYDGFNGINAVQERALDVWTRGNTMRNKAVAEAIEAAEKENEEGLWKKPIYNELIEKARKCGGHHEKDDNDYGNAETYIKKAFDLIPTEFPAKWGLATIYTETGRLEQGLEMYDKLIKEHADHVAIHKFECERGLLLLGMKRKEEGKACLVELFAATEEMDNLLHGFSAVLYEDKEFDTALIYSERYLEKYPHNYKAWTIKGKCLIALGRKSAGNKALAIAGQIITGRKM